MKKQKLQFSICAMLALVALMVTAMYCIRANHSQRGKQDFKTSADIGTVGSKKSHVVVLDPVRALTEAFKTPIELYGNVVDQHGGHNPVPGATVTLSPVDAPFGDESRSGTVLVSDAKGKFSVKGLHGFSMGVSVKKEGYLHLSPLGGPASSAMVVTRMARSKGNATATPATPLVLTLHKIGPMEPVAYVKERRCRLPVDGTVRRIALAL